jgi:hypothetical protein
MPKTGIVVGTVGGTCIGWYKSRNFKIFTKILRYFFKTVYIAFSIINLTALPPALR